MKWKIPAACASALIGAITSLTPSVSYAVLVQGFETGLPVGSTTGDALVTGTFQGIAPVQGSNQLLLTTINQTSDGIAPLSGANAVTVNTVAGFVGVPLATLQFNATNTGKEGSAFKMTLNLNVGDVLTFNYDFLTAEDPTDPLAPQDFGFASLVLAGSLVNYQILGNTSAAVLTSSGPTFFNQTGYQTYTFTVTTAGSYTLGIGVLDAKGVTGQSGLLVDNISVTAVPEPSTIGLGLAGAALLIALRRRIKIS